LNNRVRFRFAQCGDRTRPERIRKGEASFNRGEGSGQFWLLVHERKCVGGSDGMSNEVHRPTTVDFEDVTTESLNLSGKADRQIS